MEPHHPMNSFLKEQSSLGWTTLSFEDKTFVIDTKGDEIGDSSESTELEEKVKEDNFINLLCSEVESQMSWLRRSESQVVVGNECQLAHYL